MQQPAVNLLRIVASPRLTPVAIAALIAGVLVNYGDREASALWLAVPFTALALNLFAALLVNRAFRRHGSLLVFHLCLLAVFLLGALIQLTSFSARLEIVEGQAFDPAALLHVRSGPWHPRDTLQRVAFVQSDIKVAYDPGLIRGRTVSKLLVPAGSAGPAASLVGDSVPYLVEGYRFYTTSNKGYAVILSWLGDDGSRITGAVHFPSFPLRDWKQEAQWTTPGGTVLELMLEPAQAVPDSGAWILDSRKAAGVVNVRTAGGTAEWQRAGASIRLDKGRLRIDDVRMWMGYAVSYNPFLPWFVAAAFVGIAALGWYLWRRLDGEAREDLEAGRPAAVALIRRTNDV